jgi:hypothetical protein
MTDGLHRLAFRSFFPLNPGITVLSAGMTEECVASAFSTPNHGTARQAILCRIAHKSG